MEPCPKNYAHIRVIYYVGKNAINRTKKCVLGDMLKKVKKIILNCVIVNYEK